MDIRIRIMTCYCQREGNPMCFMRWGGFLQIFLRMRPDFPLEPSSVNVNHHHGGKHLNNKKIDVLLPQKEVVLLCQLVLERI